MNSELVQAADAVKNASRPFRALILLADAIEKFGGLEAYERELLLRVEAAKGKAAELDALLAKIKEAEALLAAEVPKAAAIIAAAAEKAGAEHMDAAKAHAEDILAAARADQDKALGRLREAEAALGVLNDTINAKKGEVAELEAKIASVKEAARKALGA